MKLLKNTIIGIMSYIALMFPVQQQHTNICCMACAMKKEDEIEVNVEEDARVC